jgi:hypothetical protein
MRTREDIYATLREINREWDAPDVTQPEMANLDAGAVMLLWVLGFEDRLYHYAGSGPLLHSVIRKVTIEILLEDRADVE